MDKYRPIRKELPGASPGGSLEYRYIPETLSSSPQGAPSAGLAAAYLRTLARSRWRLILFGVAGLILGLLFTLPSKPLYRTRTSLDVQSLNENFMNMHAVDPSGASGNYSAESNLQTHIRLLQSDDLFRRVIRKLSAESNVGVRDRDLFSRLVDRLGIRKAPETPRADLLLQTAKSVKVKPIGLTRLVEINCDSADPDLGAQFCNTLAKEYVDQDFEIRAETAQQTNTWLTRQLGDVRGNLAQKEERLLAYARDNKILFNQETDSVNQEKLKQDQLELSRAEADRVTKQSTNELLNTASPDSLPPVLDSGPLKSYQEKLTDLQRTKAELSASLTPNHPKVLRVQAQIDELRSSIDKEKGNVIARMRNEFQAAKSRENLLKQSYQLQENVVAGEVAKAAQFKMLRQEVESERTIYESLMQRVREAGLVSMMRTSPVRVVDRAIPATIPFAPNRLSSAGMGLLLGGLAGLVFVFWSDRTAPRLHMPGDSRLQFNVRELGVIPSSRVDGRLQAGAGLELITLQNERSLLAESYRATMNSILFRAQQNDSAPVIVVSSPNVAEGKTSLVCNLGIALAETKRRVVIVDGDLRRPRLHQIFKIPNDFGVTNILEQDEDLDRLPVDAIAQASGVPHLSIVASGSKAGSNISTLLHSTDLERLLDKLREHFDIVLIDTPPLLHISDARIMGRLSDGMVLVFRSGLTTLEAATTVQQTLAHDDIHLLGTVLNDFDPSTQARYGYYKSYYAHNG